jgi:hypothetical protein
MCHDWSKVKIFVYYWLWNKCSLYIHDQRSKDITKLYCWRWYRFCCLICYIFSISLFESEAFYHFFTLVPFLSKFWHWTSPYVSELTNAFRSFPLVVCACDCLPLVAFHYVYDYDTLVADMYFIFAIYDGWSTILIWTFFAPMIPELENFWL